jgi:hypothetical protein
MMAQISKPQQLHFDFIDTIPDVPDKRRIRPWYYVTKERNTLMLLSFDYDGLPVWVEHDLRSTIPHVFNCHQRALQAATRLHGAVQSCYYDRHSSKWRNYDPDGKRANEL